MVLLKAMFSCLGNNSITFHSYSSDWASHGLHPHIHPTGINGPWPCAHLRVGIKSLGAVWVGLSPTCFCGEEFGKVAGAVIDIQAHFHSSFWGKDGFLAAGKITRTQSWKRIPLVSM